MDFLESYDAVPADNPQAQMGTVIHWLRSDWRAMYAALRERRPVLQTPAFTMVTRATDVLDILAQPSLYSVKANRRAMDPGVGPFMLARDETEINWEEKGLMRAVLRWEDLPKVRNMASEICSGAVSDAQGGTLDVVPTIARMVPLKIVQQIFGFSAPDDQMLRWSFASQHGMFRNLPFSQQVLDDCVTAGQEMRSWLWPFLAEKWAKAPLDGEDSVSRLVNLSRQDAAGISAERVLTNICGLLVGSIETSSQAIVQAMDQLLANPDWLSAALQADADGDVAAFDAHIFEALRFNPITTIQFRYCEADRTIGAGTDYATPVKAGTILAVCTGSAMFDAALMPEPEQFDASRPAHSYMHFGLGHHECLGRHVGQVAIPEAVRHIIRLPGISRVDGEAGQIDFANGPFPEHFHVQWSADESQHAAGKPLAAEAV